jgi:hypothetical protein
MYNLARLTVVKSTVAGNHATVQAGGINNYGRLTLIRVTFAGNTTNDLVPRRAR